MDATNTNELNALLKRLLDEAEGKSPPTGPAPKEEDENPSPPPPAVPSESLPTVSADTVASDTSASDTSASDTSAAATSAAAASAAGSPLSTPLAGLFGNPAFLSALPTLLENIGPLLGSRSGGTGSAPTATRPHVIDRHTALLCAVKPYLSPERQNAADTVIRLCRIWDALERSGISLTGLLGAIPVGASATGQGESHDGR